MKKLLLSFLCLVGFLIAGANEVTFDFKNNKYGLTAASGSEYPDVDKTITYEGVSITLNKLTGSGVRYWGADNTFRVNKNSGITVKAEGYKITSITFTGNANLNKFTTGEVGTYNTTDHVWKGVAESVDFVNDNGSTIQIETMKVVFSEDGTAPEEPEPDPVELTEVKNIKETIALESGTAVKVDYALTVGFVNNRNVFVCDEAGDFIQIYNENTLKVGDVIPAGWEATYTLFNGVTPELEKCTLPAEVTAGTFTPAEVAVAALTKDMVNHVVMVKDVVVDAATPATKDNFTAKVGETEITLRNNYALSSVPAGTYDMTILVTLTKEGEVSLYVVSYNVEEEPGEEPGEDPEEPAGPTEVKSVRETIAVASNSQVKIDYALTVAFVNNSNIFVCDEAGDFIQIYCANTLKVGDVIPAGWEAKYSLYGGTTPELTDCTLPTEITTGTFAPAEVDAADITTDLVNSVVMVMNVEFAEATPSTKTNFTGKVGDVTLNFRNNYTIAGVPAGTYDVTFVVTIYSGATSLYVISYNVEEEPVQATEVKSVKETLALASGTPIKVGYDLTVGWVFSKNIFACDAAGDFIQIYNTNTLKPGDVIPAGWEATYTLFNDVTPEIEKAELPETVTAGTFTAKEVAAADINTSLVNSVVLIKDVVLDAATPTGTEEDKNAWNFTGKVGDTTLNFRNNYKVESVAAGTYDITVVVTIYNGEPSLYVTNFAKSSGLANITVDANAPVEYYNLNGIRVANPENGVFIRVQGSNVEKVVK